MISNTLQLRSWILCIAAVSLFGGTAIAQAPRNGQAVVKRPSRPVISPYLNLGRDYSGVLPSYQAFVIPQIEQNQQSMNQWRLQNQNRLLEDTLGTESTLRPTGQGGKFQNTLHFYPTPRTRK